MCQIQQSDTLLGNVISVDAGDRWFVMRSRSGEELSVHVGGDTEQDGGTTDFDVLSNLDEVTRDAVLPPQGASVEGSYPALRLRRRARRGGGFAPGTQVDARRVEAYGSSSTDKFCSDEPRIQIGARNGPYHG